MKGGRGGKGRGKGERRGSGVRAGAPTSADRHSATVSRALRVAPPGAREGRDGVRMVRGRGGGKEG